MSVLTPDCYQTMCNLLNNILVRNAGGGTFVDVEEKLMYIQLCKMVASRARLDSEVHDQTTRQAQEEEQRAKSIGSSSGNSLDGNSPPATGQPDPQP